MFSDAPQGRAAGITMIAAIVSFGHLMKDISRDDASDAAETYLSALSKNGQIDRHYHCAWHRGELTGYVQLARPGAESFRHHNRYGKKHLAQLNTLFNRRPRWEIVDDDVRKRLPSWKSASSLYLFTHAFDDESPVMRGDDGVPVPVYLLPVDALKREELLFWAWEYQSHDQVWLRSGELEMPAYKQLVDPFSRLSENGRAICRSIEDATGVPTYYYLMRYWGRREGEEQRRCPGCGGDWRATPVGQDDQEFWEFHFRCDQCRLVSHVGTAYPDGRHARIGEYRASRKKR